MITKVFSVFDSKACMFNTPFFVVNRPAAIRNFSDLANDPQSFIFKHAGDFVLYEIGEYDDDKGLLIPHAQHVHLGVASQFKASSSEGVFNDSFKDMVRGKVQEVVQ